MCVVLEVLEGGGMDVLLKDFRCEDHWRWPNIVVTVVVFDFVLLFLCKYSEH